MQGASGNDEENSIIVDFEDEVEAGNGFGHKENPGSMSSDNTASWCSNLSDQSAPSTLLGKRKRGRPSKTSAAGGSSFE